MKLKLQSLLLALGILLLPQARSLAAEQRFESSAEQVQLIELYTSEGCSSCPPADKHLSRLKSDGGLWRERIPLAFHVDYWDYIGWEDPFATAENSMRQRTHAAVGNVSSVYTPGFVVDGDEWRGFFRRGPLPQPKQSMPGPMTLAYEAGQIKVTFDPATTVDKELRLQLAWLGAGLEVQVTRGENTGRRLKHDFVVLKREELPLSAEQSYTHQGAFTAEGLPSADQYALVAWLEGRQGRPVQAVGGWAMP